MASSHSKQMSIALTTLANSNLWDEVNGGRVVVACSGGRDSLALLHCCSLLLRGESAEWFAALRRERMPEWVPPALSAWHLDHGLRPGSAEDAAFVTSFAGQLGLATFVEEASLQKAGVDQPANLEARARTERYRRLTALCDQLAAERSPVLALTAHHQRDQAETVLLRLARGARLRGMQGILPRLGTYVCRPWLELPEESIGRHCEQYGLRWREDATNTSLSLRRNLLRHRVLPVLQQVNPQAVRNVAAVAGLARQTLQALAELEEFSVEWNPTGQIAARLLPLPLAPELELLDLRKRLAAPALLQACLESALEGCVPSHLRADVLKLIQDARGSLRVNRYSFDCRVRGLLLRYETPSLPAAPDSLHLDQPLLRGRWRWQLRTGKEPSQFAPQVRWDGSSLAMAFAAAKAPEAYSAWLPANTPLPLRIISWEAGMKIRRQAAQQLFSVLVSDIFNAAKLPHNLRSIWPIVTDDAGTVVWIPGLADSAAMRLLLPDQPALELSVAPAVTEGDP